MMICREQAHATALVINKAYCAMSNGVVDLAYRTLWLYWLSGVLGSAGACVLFFLSYNDSDPWNESNTARLRLGSGLPCCKQWLTISTMPSLVELIGSFFFTLTSVLLAGDPNLRET